MKHVLQGEKSTGVLMEKRGTLDSHRTGVCYQQSLEKLPYLQFGSKGMELLEN
jgi:hypothetical protein